MLTTTAAAAELNNASLFFGQLAFVAKLARDLMDILREYKRKFKGCYLYCYPIMEQVEIEKNEVAKIQPFPRWLSLPIYCLQLRTELLREIGISHFRIATTQAIQYSPLLPQIQSSLFLCSCSKISIVRSVKRIFHSDTFSRQICTNTHHPLHLAV